MQKEEQKKPAISRDNIGFISLQPFKMFKDVFFFMLSAFPGEFRSRLFTLRGWRKSAEDRINWWLEFLQLAFIKW